MSRFDLLPPNSTQFERDVSRTVSSLQRAGGPVPVIRTAKRVDIPDSVVPWLIYEYGLGEILPYLGNDQRRAVAEGVLWQRIRGTPESIAIALGWIGLQGTIDESEGGSYRWSEFQIGLPAATQGEAIINDIVGVARISAPVRSRLQRIYAVYDFRRFVLDDSLLSDGGILSDHSGVRPRPDWPQISYGQVLSALVDAAASVLSAHTAGAGALVIADDVFRLDHSLLDEEWHLPNLPGLLTETIGLSAKYEGQNWGWFGWLDQPWGTPNVLAFSSMRTESADSPFRVAGLHMDGSLADEGGGTYTSLSLSFITTGQVFGSGAARISTPGHIKSEAVYPFDTADFTFRLWINMPNPGFGSFIAGRYTASNDHFGIFIGSDGLVMLRRHRLGESFLWFSIGAITFNQPAFIEFGRVDGVLRGSVNGIASSNAIPFSDNLGVTWYDIGYYSAAMTVDDFELLIGKGPRTADFTPPTAAFI